jgi:hypothetical protein
MDIKWTAASFLELKQSPKSFRILITILKSLQNKFQKNENEVF